MLTPNAPPSELTWLDRLAEETTWGRYLADLEKGLILHGLGHADGRGSAIDTGCGGGRWSRLLSDHGWDVTSTDIDANALAVCQHNNPNAKCILVNTTDRSIPADSESLRLVLCMEAPQLVEADWLPAEVSRVLSDRGLVVGVQFNLRSWRSLLWHWNRKFRGRVSDGSYTISYSDWRERFLQAGFEMIYEAGFCWGPFSRTSNSALVPVFAQAERIFRLHRFLRWSPWVLFIARKV